MCQIRNDNRDLWVVGKMALHQCTNEIKYPPKVSPVLPARRLYNLLRLASTCLLVGCLLVCGHLQQLEDPSDFKNVVHAVLSKLKKF